MTNENDMTLKQLRLHFPTTRTPAEWLAKKELEHVGLTNYRRRSRFLNWVIMVLLLYCMWIPVAFNLDLVAGKFLFFVFTQIILAILVLLNTTIVTNSFSRWEERWKIDVSTIEELEVAVSKARSILAIQEQFPTSSYYQRSFTTGDRYIVKHIFLFIKVDDQLYELTEFSYSV
jgi:hypothetical protein